MNLRKLSQLVEYPFAVFYTPSSKGLRIHIFKDGEFQYTLSVGISTFRNLTPKGARRMRCSFWLSKTLPGGEPLDFLDSDIFDSRKEAEEAADEELYRLIEELGL